MPERYEIRSSNILLTRIDSYVEAVATAGSFIGNLHDGRGRITVTDTVKNSNVLDLTCPISIPVVETKIKVGEYYVDYIPASVGLYSFTYPITDWAHFVYNAELNLTLSGKPEPRLTASMALGYFKLEPSYSIQLIKGLLDTSRAQVDSFLIIPDAGEDEPLVFNTKYAPLYRSKDYIRQALFRRGSDVYLTAFWTKWLS